MAVKQNTNKQEELEQTTNDKEEVWLVNFAAVLLDARKPFMHAVRHTHTHTHNDLSLIHI